MKSNRNSQDPSSNRKGGTPFWEKMQPKKKTSFERKTDPLERTKHRPVKHGAISKEKGWDQVAKWYDQLVGDEGSDYHKNIIVPAILERLGELGGARVLDLCCGQGFIGKLLLQAGAARVHGVDASPQLIESAVKRAAQESSLSYEVADGSAPGAWADGSYDVALNIMAVHDVENLEGLCHNLANSLKSRGKALMVFMHPCFRMPKQSHWGWDQEKKIQYRRMDRYGSAMSIPITTHPGRAVSETTTFYHRPLPLYFQSMKQAGLAITDCEELFSHRRSQVGPRSKAEHFAAEEFPMFLLLEVQRLAK